MGKLLALLSAVAVCTSLLSTTYAQSSDEALAVLVPGGGTYSRPISTDSPAAQAFDDSGALGDEKQAAAVAAIGARVAEVAARLADR